MRELTENIFKEINRILSLMDEFHDKEKILNQMKHEDNENEKIEKRVKKQETYFDLLYDNYCFIPIIWETEKKIVLMFNQLMSMLDNEIEKWNGKHEEMGTRVNEMLNELEEIEELQKGYLFTKEYVENNYTSLIVETEVVKQKRIQLNERIETIRRERLEKETKDMLERMKLEEKMKMKQQKEYERRIAEEKKRKEEEEKRMQEQARKREEEESKKKKSEARSWKHEREKKQKEEEKRKAEEEKQKKEKLRLWKLEKEKEKKEEKARKKLESKKSKKEKQVKDHLKSIKLKECWEGKFVFFYFLFIR